MPALKNPRHEAFAQAVALNMPASQAYAEYVSGGKCSERTAEVTGSTLANSSEVSLRIAELRSKVSERAEKKFDMTKDKWLDELAAIAKESRETGDFSAATGALREIGKGAAFYEPERHSLEVSVIIGGNAEGHD
jgi:hypothetical protein